MYPNSPATENENSYKKRRGLAPIGLREGGRSGFILRALRKLRTVPVCLALNSSNSFSIDSFSFLRRSISLFARLSSSSSSCIRLFSDDKHNHPLSQMLLRSIDFGAVSKPRYRFLEVCLDVLHRNLVRCLHWYALHLSISKVYT